MKWFRLVLSFVGLAGLLLFLNFGFGRIPALGPLLDPFHGIWQNGKDNPVRWNHQTLPGLKANVQVFWDKNSIPHIQAQNKSDLFMAQGYLEASDRLFQMELQSRLTSGRLSEWLGEKVLSVDEKNVAFGFREVASQSHKLMMENLNTKIAIESYVKGVNEYIAQLSEDDYPPEYKLLGVKPKRWTGIEVSYLVKMMGSTLAGRSLDLDMTALLKALGDESVRDLFPSFPYNVVPIIGSPNNFPQRTKVNQPAKEVFKSYFDRWPKYVKPKKGNGSNNWAVHRSRTKNRKTLLANDTHLSYKAPALWYEIQLITPSLNVYGASIPGSPGVMIGFNQNVGWAITNAPTDVMDWYELNTDLRNGELFYQEAKNWVKARKSVEVIEVRGGHKISKTLWWTKYGIIVHRLEDGRSLALKWKVHEPSNEILAFLELNEAKNHEECKRSLVHRVSPPQNIICADKDDISIEVNGAMIKKWPNQGRYVLKGGEKKFDWAEDVPRKYRPWEQSPSQGFVFSSNQHPVNGEFPYYVGWRYRDSYRAERVKEYLSVNRTDFTWQDMQELQNDLLNLLARDVLPSLLELVDLNSVSKDVQAGLSVLKQWDFVDGDDQVGPSLFWGWWERLTENIWKKHWSKDLTKVRPMDSRLAKLVLDVVGQGRGQHNEIAWVKNKAELAEIALNSFSETWQDLQNKHGKDISKWIWNKVRENKIPHMAKIPGWGHRSFDMGGSRVTVNSNKGGHGPVWRMIVEIGENQVRGWSNYPGGQTGNPLNKDFQMFTPSWAKGELRPIRFLIYGKPNLEDGLRKIRLDQKGGSLEGSK